MYDKSQLNKGLLEGCVLKLIQIEGTYAYDIVQCLVKKGFKDSKEGTIYPLLVRLEKKELISSHYRPSPLGPNRKYYDITEKGIQYLNEFIDAWKETQVSVNSILGGV